MRSVQVLLLQLHFVLKSVLSQVLLQPAFSVLAEVLKRCLSISAIIFLPLDAICCVRCTSPSSGRAPSPHDPPPPTPTDNDGHFDEVFVKLL